MTNRELSQLTTRTVSLHDGLFGEVLEAKNGAASVLVLVDTAAGKNWYTLAQVKTISTTTC